MSSPNRVEHNSGSESGMHASRGVCDVVLGSARQPPILGVFNGNQVYQFKKPPINCYFTHFLVILRVKPIVKVVTGIRYK